MNEYIYEIAENGIVLYRLESGIKKIIDSFPDREELLFYLEEQGYSKLYIKGR